MHIQAYMCVRYGIQIICWAPGLGGHGGMQVRQALIAQCYSTQLFVTTKKKTDNKDILVQPGCLQSQQQHHH
jgi:hypothetical protein